MQGSKEYFLRVKEEEYFDLPQALRERSVVYYNDYELYKDNPSFKALNKALLISGHSHWNPSFISA